MKKQDYGECKTKYKSKKIKIRTFAREPGKYEVSVGRVSDIFRGWELVQYSEYYTLREIARRLKSSHPKIYRALEEEKLPVDGLAFAIARVRTEEIKQEIADMNMEMRYLRVSANRNSWK